MSFKEYDQYDGLGLAELVKTRKISAAELLETAIAKAQALNPSINAISVEMYDMARDYCKQQKSFQGVFAGVPFLIKDLSTMYKGARTTNGSQLTENFVANHDSNIVTRFKDAGLITFGKTNSCEFGLQYITEPELHNPTHNPWDLSRTSGGSSGGSAAAVAARIAPVAHASDGGGSIRIPASCCGLFGLKTTRARISPAPDAGEGWAGLSGSGVVSLSVRDTAAMLDVMSGYVKGDPYCAPPAPDSYLSELTDPPRLRIGVCNKAFTEESNISQDSLDAMQHAQKLCKDLGHEIDEVELSFDVDALGEAMLVIVSTNIHATLNDLAALNHKKISETDVEPLTWMIYQQGVKHTAIEYAKAIATLHSQSRKVTNQFAKFDVLLTPTLAKPPVKIGSLQQHYKDIESFARAQIDFGPFTTLFNQTGQPAMSVPLYWNKEGLPIGVQFAGQFGDELTLLQLARQLEKTAPWFDKRPEIIANQS